MLVYTENVAEARNSGVGGYCGNCDQYFCSNHVGLQRLYFGAGSSDPLAQSRAPLVALCPTCSRPLSGADGSRAISQAIESARAAQAGAPSSRANASEPAGVLGLTNREARHRSAVEIINRRKKYGSPFVLYLRDFLRGSREGVVKSHYFTPSSRFTIENTLIRRMAPQVGVVFVQSEAEEVSWSDRSDGELGPVGPSLRLPEDAWQQEVRNLIGLAEIIIVDAPLLSEGTRFELECCARGDTIHRTVVILAPPNVLTGEKRLYFSQDADPLVQRFPRVSWSDDIHDDLVREAAIHDLVERAFSIAALSADRRDADLATEKELRSAIGVTYEGVARRYMFTANLRSATRVPWHPEPWKDNWERTFWDFHRAVLTMHAMMDLKLATAKECAAELVRCYQAMVNLLGEAMASEQGFVLRGSFEMCRQLSIAAIKFAELCEEREPLRACEEMLEEVSQRRMRLKAESIPCHSLLSTLYLAHSNELITV
jgi:hypothetical protein